MSKQVRKKRKPKTLAKLADDCAIDLQLLVRLKASNDSGECQCVSCGVVKHWKQMQGGHYMGRRVIATKLLEENIHPQCKACNLKATESHVGYSLHMIETYGIDFVKYIQSLISDKRGWNRREIESLHADIKTQIDEQKTRLGIEK